MRSRYIALACAALLGAIVLTNLTWRRRSIMREISADVEAPDRYVDVGVILHTVVSDPDGEILIPGKPAMRILRTRQFGGVLDTRRAVPCIVARSVAPRVWYCSEEQEIVLLHNDPLVLGQLAYGSEGAGKTRVLAMWHYFRWLENLGERRCGGQTAPTDQRLSFFREEVRQLYGGNWFRHRIADDVYVMCDGSKIQLVSTYRQSKAQGSPIQGFNWSWCGRDEAQDQIDVHEDIESRGRAARDGLYKQLATATAKDDSAWRAMRDRLLAGGRWVKRQLSIFRSPFVAVSFIEAKRGSMSDREFRRRYGADDLPPERAVYPAWDRTKNLITVPDIGWEDVTSVVLAHMGANLCALVGHDPGQLYDVSLILKAYRIGRGRPSWVVVDEITTEQTTTEQHVATLLQRAGERWGLNLRDRNGQPVKDGPRMLVRADPYGNNDNKTDRTTYTIFRNAGILIHPAAYSSLGNTTGPGRVPLNEGIEVVNTLLCNAANERRLFVARDKAAVIAAPQLVRAIESSERDLNGKAEVQRKDKNDVSHWPAALRYALWSLERPRLLNAGSGQ